MMVLKHATTAERQIVGSLEGIDTDVWAETSEPVPNDLEGTAYRFEDDVGPVAIPRILTSSEVVALYTATEKARIFTSTIDQVRQLLIALQFSPGIACGGTEHSQGTALIAGLGLLDAPERAARILSGLPPT